MRFVRILMLLAAGGALYAQTSAPWDNTGNGMLNGAYYFRQLYYVLGDNSGDLAEAVTLYGTITFDGNGNYSITNAQVIDYSYSSGQVANYGAFTTTGAYAIAASGYGFLASPYATGDYVYGMVSANGVFVGSTTDTTAGYNDMFVAAQLASPAPTGSTFAGSWTAAVLDMTAGSPSGELSFVANMSPDSAGNLNITSINGYEGGSTQPVTQTNSGLKYVFSSGAAVATFPAYGNANSFLMSGQKYFYFSKDGNFMFGGSPVTSQTPFDFIVAVRSSSSNTLSGLYYQAGVDSNSATADLDSYFGSFNMIAGAAPQTYLGHQRINDYAGSAVYDYTYDNTITISGNGYTNGSTRFIAGAGGAELITSGISPTLGISVALKAPTPSGSGTYINPTGVVNAASNAPFTAGIAPGELLTIYGSSLAPSTAVAGIPFPTTGLNGVQVTIGGLPAAIFYVASTQISAIVPYGLTVGSIAAIQVNNNGSMSNIVTNYVANTAPGVFTQSQNGIGYGEIEHLGIGNSVSTPGSVVTTTNPAIEGETLAAYLTGLGAVTTPITDGAAGPATPDATTNTIGVDFSGVAGTNDFSGLAPGYSGLYQLNLSIPATGIAVGPNYLDISGPDSYMSYLLMPIQATISSITTTGELSPQIAIPSRVARPRAHAMPTQRNQAEKKPFSEIKKK